MVYINPNSTIDYPGKTAAVLGLPGCNLRCPYCQNPELALAKDESIYWDEINSFFDFLQLRNGFIDGVVISGGEPTIQWNLDVMCEYIKELGYPVKLDTNGTRPDMISYLIERKLIDYVALSLKPENYAPVLDYTIPLLVSSGVKFEIRIVAVSSKISDDVDSQSFGEWLEIQSHVLKNHGINGIKLHRHNKDAKILNPNFYEGEEFYYEWEYQRLAEIVRGQGLECEVV